MVLETCLLSTSNQFLNRDLRNSSNDMSHDQNSFERGVQRDCTGSFFKGY